MPELKAPTPNCTQEGGPTTLQFRRQRTDDEHARIAHAHEEDRPEARAHHHAGRG